MSTPRIVARRLLSSCMMAVVTVASASAQIVTDGTAGPARTLQGPDYDVSEGLGTRRGANLFHSFDRFDIRTLPSGRIESVTFRGSPEIANVLSRVTGGSASEINGVLRSEIPGADLFLLNPNGVVFGPNAELDVGGSFHASTADELRFADGTTYGADAPTAGSFTTAPPESFGFLGPAAGDITVDRGRLEVGTGETISLTGGDIAVTAGGEGAASDGEAGTVRAEAGAARLTAVGAPGTVDIGSGATNAPALGAIVLRDEAFIDVSGDGGGAISIRSGTFDLSENSFVFADNTGVTDAEHGITIDTGAMTVGSGSLITTDVEGAGNAGDVSVRAEALEVRAGGQIKSSTSAAGAAGEIRVEARDILLARDGSGIDTGILGLAGVGSSGDGGNVIVKDAATLEVSDGAVITTSTVSTGDAGSVEIDTDQLSISGNSSVIASRTAGTGDAGSINVTAYELKMSGIDASISIDNLGDATSTSKNITIDAHYIQLSNSSSISSESSSSGGEAGNIDIDTENFNFGDGTKISASSFFAGEAGNVTVKAGKIMMVLKNTNAVPPTIGSQADFGTAESGSVFVEADEIAMRDGSVISTSTTSDKDAGKVVVNADLLLLSGELTAISSDGLLNGGGTGGSVRIYAEHLRLREGARISAERFLGRLDAGDISVFAKKIDLSGISAETGDPTRISSQSIGFGSGGAGEIKIRAQDVEIRDGAEITSVSALGTDNAGDIELEADGFVRLSDGSVTTSAANGQGGGGNISIDPDVVVLDRSSIIADAREGDGGNIDITAASLLRTSDSTIDASSELGLPGTVQIRAATDDVTRSVEALATPFLDASALMREACAARGADVGGSLTRVGRGGVRQSPEPGAPVDYGDLAPTPSAAPARWSFLEALCDGDG